MTLAEALRRAGAVHDRKSGTWSGTPFETVLSDPALEIEVVQDRRDGRLFRIEGEGAASALRLVALGTDPASGLPLIEDPDGGHRWRIEGDIARGEGRAVPIA